MLFLYYKDGLVLRKYRVEKSTNQFFLRVTIQGKSTFLGSKVIVTRVWVVIFSVANVKTNLLRVFAQNRKSCLNFASGRPQYIVSGVK